MTVDKPASGAEGTEAPPIPWFGPTLHELVPGAAPGIRPPILRRQVGQALAAARQDPVRQELIRQADRVSRDAVGSLVAEMLTPPLPRNDPEELP
ncbi:hypothetical protein PV379_41280 [Streptomyces caniscabiei]|uniref:hypothetical protein n=1 Tax=Streptomyces caniscabiei TaxID=2746961 RepID=UPI0029A6C8B8|nr:hypothetical protein [Streptomyces caniscabiei]MDX2599626.1 hypothetical protein [Streptomyces caniscabiei]MDX2735079.1 hypothetical protein [Streptomyces caniscabiei]MDX2783699.1 hypothetical protein [Streptomyces caniscabiei]